MNGHDERTMTAMSKARAKQEQQAMRNFGKTDLIALLGE